MMRLERFGLETEADKDAARNYGAWIEKVVDGKMATLIMTLLTLFVLWGEDMRLAFAPRSVDIWFDNINTVALVLFLAEFFANSIVKQGHKWGFDFWLNLIAALSIIPDIRWVQDVITILTSADTNSGSGEEVSVKNLGAARMARLLRLVRLVRVVKLYANIRKAADAEREERMRAQARAATNYKQAALKRVEASRLGKVLSESTTKKVIIGILAMLIIGEPLLQVATVNHSKPYGLQGIFWVGSSACRNNDDLDEALRNINKGTGSSLNVGKVDYLQCPPKGSANWMSEEGWATMLYLYSQVSTLREPAGTEIIRPAHPLLWLRVPDMLHGGQIRDIDEVNSPLGPWKSDAACSGIPFPEETCHLRNIETKTIAFRPYHCSSAYESHTDGCEGVVAYARFDTQQDSINDAIFSTIRTAFVCVVLFLMSQQFQSDTQRLVIAPIEKMVNIIKQLAEDPLRMPETQVEDDDELSSRKKKGKKGGPQLETKLLENTILKIGGLLQVGFGSSGAEIIGKNMSTGEGDLNIMMPGHMVTAIFGFTDIRDFTSITEILQEDIMIFINSLGAIIQGCVHHWSGVSNKNIGDAFLVLWKTQTIEHQTAKKGAQEAAQQMSQLSDKALMAFVKILAEIRRSKEIAQKYGNNPRLADKYGEGRFKVRVGLSLHMGWAIEGPVGSELKVDASYLSPHVNMAMFLESTTKMYQQPIICSQRFYTLLSLRGKERMRKVDNVKIGEVVTGLYVFNYNKHAPVVVPPVDPPHKLGQLIRPEALEDIPVATLEAEGAEFLFVADRDVSVLQEGIPDQLNQDYRIGLAAFIDGDWAKAKEIFEDILSYWEDGPTQALLAYLARHNYVAIADWPGYRVLDLNASANEPGPGESEA